jgi:hypothetical protein
LDRIAASVGVLNGASIEFELVKDVPDGGVLFALPALLVLGLLNKGSVATSQFYRLFGCECRYEEGLMEPM